jgi:methyl-accepting chemotaxis protein
LAIIISNRVTRPINNAIDVAQRISSGDRAVRIITGQTDETGLLLKSLSSMQESIKTSEDQLKDSSKKTKELFDDIALTAKVYSDHTEKVSSGDFRVRLQLNGKDDVMRKLGTDLNVMTDSLSMITKQIIEACHNMVSTLEEVRHAVDSQSSGATEQASSINEITSSLSEIDKSTAQTMDKAKELGEVAQRTQDKGKLGLDSVEMSVRGMKSIRDKVEVIADTILDLSKQTQQIGEITSVVNSLAQQSKMLALNASIEAAKAGDAGKGFAVVASEVRNLAEQSEQSTTQVQKILENIRQATEKAVMVTEEGTKGVDEGTRLVEQTGEIMRNLNDVIRDTTLASEQITAAITQEGVGIEQISIGMNEINQVTGTFVDSVKQTTEAINNLADIAQKLKNRVDSYKV